MPPNEISGPGLNPAVTPLTGVTPPVSAGGSTNGLPRDQASGPAEAPALDLSSAVQESYPDAQTRLKALQALIGPMAPPVDLPALTAALQREEAVIA
jgi:hypothetical protein